ncbi:uncharacterized protein LOC128984398 [Macrosteles quadrilineatus]|uniref:uncharacterized protein LOC128984398 n=1 Tax=Macrosteles quadrilineatus TaxID=74068 RepID=UPI0023E23403|nr:uncharacterized protein LOC128984398 [Macrosteles quadrilineatus]
MKARERQRKRRSLMTEEQLELKRAKNREYMAKKKQEEKENPKEISDREKRRLAKLNRERVQKWREKKKGEKIAESQKHIDNLTSDNTINEQTTPSNKRDKKHTGSSSKKLLQHNKTLEAEKYKKRFQRLANSDNSPSPSKKIRKLAGGKKLP